MELTSESQEEVDNASEVVNLKKVEAAFFIAARWLSLQELVTLTDVNPILLRELIEKLQEKYNNESSAIEILQKEDSWKMDVKAEYRNIINKLATGSSEFTKAEQGTLAIIAYKQPFKQIIIIKIRGNKAYEHVKKFREVGLLKAKKQGHTYILNLSEEFYEYFNVGKEKVKQETPEEIEQEIQKEIREKVEETKQKIGQKIEEIKQEIEPKIEEKTNEEVENNNS